MDSDVIGFVGIGKMGQPMARRLVDAGRRLVVYDVDAGATAPLVALGAKAAGSVSEVADAAGTVLLSLPAPRVVQDVVAQLAGGAKVKRVVDFSTIGPAAAASAAATLDARGIAYIDAPVSGGVPGAQAGTLAVMVSCPKALFETLQELLGTFGKTFHVGEQAGQAQTMKLANNLLSATAIAISSEAMAMGVKAGLDPRVMLDIINAGSGRNSATQDKFPRAVLTGTFDYGFGTGLAYKDVRLCIDEAEQLGVPMVIGAAVRQMLAITNSLYGPGSDYTSVCRVVESWAGVEVRG
ncbi:NAD(P)-dependent oxidoreductase [Bordetella petrii]|uniref:NAD(P)-dependent oxidoreductase n=1 Tax=Bordetella petrii TaxID=94624 RepID=UPI00047A9D03|nr:NAD(P)-dependent oxidoreductase [Bordetella petrii]